MMGPRRKQPSFMTPWRWAVISILAVILLLLSLQIYYSSIQADRWNEQTKFEAKAAAEAGLVKIQSSSKFIWDESYWIIEGTDKNNQAVYVWVGEKDNRMETVNAANAFPPEELRARLKKEKAGLTIVRIQPGKLGNQKAWEVFYSLNESQRHYYYDFYDFTDGKLIRTYKLPAKLADTDMKSG